MAKTFFLRSIVLGLTILARFLSMYGAPSDPFFLQGALNQIKPKERAVTVIPRPAGLVRIESDKQEKNDLGVWVAEGKVVITYQDSKLEADRVEYFEDSNYAIATGNVVLTRGPQRMTGQRVEYDIDTGGGHFYQVEGNTGEEYYFEAQHVEMFSRTTFRVDSGFITACQEAVPKWLFSARSTFINTESHATMRNSFFKIKKWPIIYLPFVRVPLEKKERSSGILLPSTGTSTTKGRSVHSAFYLVMGRSADVIVSGDYFSKRGLGLGLRLRMRPSEKAWLNFSFYEVRDRTEDERFNAGGAHISAQGEAYLKGGFRGVVNVSLFSNIRFLQVFAQDFRAATNTVERSSIFLTNNFGANSVNFMFARNENFFPFRSLVVRNAPVINFKTLGRQVTDLPLYFFLDSSIEGLNRIQQPDASTVVLTPEFVQRFDLFPRLLVPFREFAGIRFSALVGVRDTFYSHSAVEKDPRVITGQPLNRRYITTELVAKGPGLTKIYRDAEGESRFKHLIEPEIMYRLIRGINHFRRIIRFDEKDAVADTNEFEYSLANRIFIKQKLAGGNSTTREVLYLRLGQKYFFDPTFGGALIEGLPNQFFPINTQTAFPYGGLRRRFSPLSGLLRWYLSGAYNAELRADYDPKAQALRNASLAGTLRVGKIGVSTTYAYTKKIQIENPGGTTRPSDREPLDSALFCLPDLPNIRCDNGTYNSNQLQAQISYGDPRKGFSMSTIHTYDLLGAAFLKGNRLAKRHMLGSTTRLFYNWDCCGVALEAQQYNIGIRTETLFRFSFTLGGVGSFGTLRRPQNLF